MSKIFYGSLYGDGLYFLPRIIKEGKQTLTYIDDKWYKKLYEGMIPKRASMTMWESEITKNDTVVFDYNFTKGVESYLRLKARGVHNIIGGSPFAYALEHDRAFCMRLFAQNGINIPETVVCKNNAQGITFIRKNEGKWVYKPNGEDTGSEETYCAETGKDMLDWIQSRPDQEFILQKFVEDGVCEVGISIYFSRGNPMNPPAHCIELKRYGTGNWGQNTGCMSSVCWYDDDLYDNPTIKETWDKLFHIFKEEEFTGQCDISGIVTKDGTFYALEATPGRFGYSQDLGFYQLLTEPISMLWEYMARGDGVKIECDKTAYGFEARCSVPPYPLEQKKGFEKETQKLIFDSRNTPIVFKPHENITYDWVDVKKSKNSEMMTAGVDAIICEVGTKDKDILGAQKRVLAAMQDIKMGGLYCRTDPFEGAAKEIEILKKLGFWSNSHL